MCPVLVSFNVVSPSPKKESLNKQPIMNGKRANESVVFPTLCELQCLGESTSYLVFFLVLNSVCFTQRLSTCDFEEQLYGRFIGRWEPSSMCTCVSVCDK